ncbi:unnamed protein product [Medioppia subpectinata]|uniref:RING-type domain-containing protein n=1 Tax=Medioppia subpectinata TaxID=1979941 RepID=A0A7R9L058_9ACAR|nr:unnamed protein product [Medioppia subpectinata]CAG2111948.1 unnamed protein product [Medioppia subpectinata]
MCVTFRKRLETTRLYTKSLNSIDTNWETMGIDVERVATKVLDEGLLCGICSDILEDPLMIDVCEHSFCRHCICRWYKTSKTCPTDRKSFTEDKLVKIPRFMNNHLNELKLKCVHYKNGCKVVATLETIDNHQKDCTFDPTERRVAVRTESPLRDLSFLIRSGYRYRFHHKLLMTSMTGEVKKNAIRLVKEALYCCGRVDFTAIAVFIKTYLEPKNARFWHCIVGTDFDCFVTASYCYLSVQFDGISIMAFKTL